MKHLQHAYEYAKRMVQRGSVPNMVMGIALLLLTVTVVHQTTRLHQLEKGALKSVSFFLFFIIDLLIDLLPY